MMAWSNSAPPKGRIHWCETRTLQPHRSLLQRTAGPYMWVKFAIAPSSALGVLLSCREAATVKRCQFLTHAARQMRIRVRSTPIPGMTASEGLVPPLRARLVGSTITWASSCTCADQLTGTCGLRHLHAFLPSFFASTDSHCRARRGRHFS